MFSNIFGVSGITVTVPAPPPSQSGALYWDGNNRAFAIVDSFGNRNQVYPQMTSVSLDPTAMSAITWATKKMQEENELAALCELHPGLKDLKEKFEVMLALVRQKE